MPTKKKNPTKTKKIAKKTLLLKPKERELTPFLVVSNGILIKKSPHLVNLKNPNQKFFELNQTLSAAGLIERPKVLVKPPRDLPRKNKNIQVNLATSDKKTDVFSQLSLVNLLQLIFQPLAKLLKRKPNKTTNDFFPKQTKTSPKNEEVEDVFAPPALVKTRGLVPTTAWVKPIILFVLLSCLVILPFQTYTYYQKLQATKDRVLFLSKDAINSLKAAQQAAAKFDLTAADSAFGAAKQNFVLAQQQVNKINGITIGVLKFLPGQGQSVESGLSLLAGGELLAEVGQILSSAGSNFLANPTSDYYQSLVKLESDFTIAIDKFQQAKAEIQKVKVTDLPAENQEAFNQVTAALPEIEKGLGDLHLINSAILKLLGHEQWQRYLVMFANNNELRGSGGFLGSFALLDVDRGKIKKMEIPAGGTYDVQGQLIPQVISPQPLHLINPRWEFQDANWWPDYPTTAKKIQWFYENAGGPTTDGVILMTASLMSQLLSALGPIELPEYNVTVSTDNFVEQTQKIIRSERDKESDQPKQIIADLGPKILERLFSAKSETVLKLMDILRQGLNEKQLLLYFSDPDLENIVSSFDWGGQIKNTDGDYLSVVHTNLAGGKTDGVITQTIQHQAEILADGSIVDTVKLIRTHNGPNDKNPFTGVQNNSYVRFYVPGGSSLIEAKGFKKPDEKYFKKPGESLKKDLDLISIETNKFYDQNSGTDIYWEDGKTVFGNWLQLKPGETQEVTIKYRLPFKIPTSQLVAQNNQSAFYYSLFAQKQSGSLGSNLTSTLKLNDNLKAAAIFPEVLKENDKQIIFNQKLNTDQFYSVVLTKS